MATSIDQKNFVKTALRLPPELHAAVHESAQKSGRSYNAELLDRIQGSFDETPSQDMVLDQAKQIWELRARLAATNAALYAAFLSLSHGHAADEVTLEVIKGLMQRNATFIASVWEALPPEVFETVSVEDDMRQIREHLARLKAEEPKA